MDRELILHFPGDVILSLAAVYKGRFDEKTLYPTKAVTVMIVSIKKLNSKSTQGFEEWQNLIPWPFFFTGNGMHFMEANKLCH
ncbi:hypothetical protein EJD97_020707 [Solanum chilense]|uniref:Uncharacterized protein n=1 Tax=Solanum chilense TaxID=4083 RepID=A0A6N2AFC6_SOLCI|nr:hypothetical protein EJD97_020707 [Solanum chilense]